MKKIRSIIAIVLVSVICISVFTGCVRDTNITDPTTADSSSKVNTHVGENDTSNAKEKADAPNSKETVNRDEILESKDTLKTKEKVKNNDIVKGDQSSDKTAKKTQRIDDDWEVVIVYDADGIVTEVFAHDDDSFQKKSYNGYEGKDYNTVVDELMTDIKEAGYFVGEIDRESNHVTIEINNRYDRDDKYEDKYDDRYDWD